MKWIQRKDARIRAVVANELLQLADFSKQPLLLLSMVLDCLSLINSGPRILKKTISRSPAGNAWTARINSVALSLIRLLRPNYTKDVDSSAIL